MGADNYTASWSVLYNDGTIVAQYDTQDSREVPYRDIDWTKATKLFLESQHIRTTIDIPHTASDRQLSLRSRHFLTHTSNTKTMCFMLVESEAGKPVNDESVYHVTYWFPNGVLHTCRLFQCHDVAKYGSDFIHGKTEGLLPVHGVTNCKTEAILA